MGRIKARVRIELRSDLCTGSGYGYAGVIDTDVACDRYGLPMIPARRLKGCMREAAQMVCQEEVNRLFGEGGKNRAEGIVLGNAHIGGYKDIIRELWLLKQRRPDVFRYLSRYAILELFTDVRAQTKIDSETGIAEDNTLRYMRVVGQYDPTDEKAYTPLCFYADIEYDSCEEKNVEKIVKATRNIGMYRNRGFGSVRCSIVPAEDKKEDKEKDGENSKEEATVESVDPKVEKRACITYILRNAAPLLMSSNSDSISDSFISGKSVLGKMAGSYLKLPGKSAESKEFRDLFLNGSTIFTDANITFPAYDKEGKFAESRQWRSYFPAPLYLNRTKKSKRLVNLLKREDAAGGGVSDKGDLPKKLKGQYVCEVKPNVYDVAEAEKEIIYHHSKNGRGAEEGQLYSQEALKEGQYFKGYIYTDSEYVSTLKKMLDTSEMRFGKSKMVQYGLCELPIEPEEKKMNRKEYSAGEGEYIVVTFVSDAIFMNGNGYTVRFEEVKGLIADKLGLDKVLAADADKMDEYSIVQTKEATGYHTAWNLRKSGVPVIKAGSAFAYQIGEGMHWEKALTALECFAGERNMEGYGEFRISKLDEMQYNITDVADLKKAEDEKEPDRKPDIRMEDLKAGRRLLGPILTENVYECLVLDYLLYRKDKVNLNASTIGRLIRMLTESLQKESKPEKAFEDFCRRIESIKRDKERREAFRFLKEILLSDSESEGYTIDFDKMREKKDAKSNKEEDDRGDKKNILDNIRDIFIECFSEHEYNELLSKLWGRYLMTVLTYQKYRKKHD